MKKLITIISFLFISQMAFSQVFYSQSSKNLRYVGAMNQEILSLFTSDEVQMYYDCVATSGIDIDSITWISDTVLHQIYYDPTYYTSKAIVKTTDNPTGKVYVENGYHSLIKPEFMVFIDRYEGNMKITLQMYY
jgi:hypothetical protein